MQKKYYYADRYKNNSDVNFIDVEGYKYLLNIYSYDFSNGDFYEVGEFKIKIEELFNDDNEISDYTIIVYKNEVLLDQLSINECYGDKLKN